MRVPNLDTVAYELFMRQYISRKIAANEHLVAATRHQTHFGLHPTALTEIFYHEYQRWLIRHLEISKDIDYAAKLPGFCKTPFDKLKKRSLVGLFEARQVADCLGMPYDDYTYLCFVVSREWDFGRTLAPADLTGDKLVAAVHEIYETGNY